MIEFFTTFIVVAGLTLVGQLWPQIAHQRDEFLPLLNFEAFVYVFFIVSGISIFASPRSQIAKKFSSFFIEPFAGAFSGWGMGLTLWVLIHGKLQDVLAGFLLTLGITLFCLSPVIMVNSVIKSAQQISGMLFPKKTQIFAVRGMSFVFLISGIVGLVVFYTKF